MVVVIRSLARSAMINCRLSTCTLSVAPAITTLGSLNPSAAACAFHRRCSNFSKLQAATVTKDGSASDVISAPEISNTIESGVPVRQTQDNPNGRHPHSGSVVADTARLVYMKISEKATEEDVKALLTKAGVLDALITMSYDISTGNNRGSCFVKLTNEQQVEATIAALSHFTFFGQDITPQKYEPKKLHQPDLSLGWLPSPSSDLETLVKRPPILAPPELLPPLMAEQWVRFENLPPVRKGTHFEVLREFYAKFYQYDVVGITPLRMNTLNRKRGSHCMIQFGSPQEAKAARGSHLNANTFMDRPVSAKIYRAGPDILQHLWKYRESLPKETTDDETRALLEEKFKQLSKQGKPKLNRMDYPTPESAIGLRDTPVSE